MALNSIQAPPGKPGVISVYRGDIGILTGVVSRALSLITVPERTAPAPPVEDSQFSINFV
jgi:hypothetical protein